jgi:ribosomal protein S18 acetylase RimI-like enzyme
MIRAIEKQDVGKAREIWNEVVDAKNAFPQIIGLKDDEEAENFFSSQTYTGVSVDDDSGEVAGLYILHPNNIGRCGHIANASYAVSSKFRNRHIGESLVRDSLKQGRLHGFRILQFNAVVADNFSAIHLYEKIGFKLIGTVKDGYFTDDCYKDINLYYINLLNY